MQIYLLCLYICVIYALCINAEKDYSTDFCDTSLHACSLTQDVTVFTVATTTNDALIRFLRSASNNNFHVEILGQGLPWTGGDVAKFAGGGQKVNLLKTALENYRNNDNLILFVDSYDVVFTNSKAILLEKYKMLGGGVLFGAELFCWPRADLETLYPTVQRNEKRFLNSGAFMGPASTIHKMLSTNTIKDDDDDQLFYTNIFLNQDLRERYNIKLDTMSNLFLNLNGAFEEVELAFTEDSGYLENKKTKVRPVVVHGNGPIKVKLNSLSNYMDHSWTPTKGCQQCKENTIEFNKDEDHPVIQVSVFVDYPMPFLDVFFERIASLTYPKSKIHFTGYFSPSAAQHKFLGERFNVTHGSQYRSITWFNQDDFVEPIDSRNRAFAYCLAIEDCKFLFSIDGTAQISNSGALTHLVHMNRSILAPMLSRRGKLWSNFWGDINPEGYYKRSDDYIDIVEGRKRGIWNVPYLQDVYLLSRHAIRNVVDRKLTHSENIHMDISSIAKDTNTFLMVDNQKEYGYLINPENYTTHHLHNDLWQIFDNPVDWEEQYIDPEFFKIAAPDVKMNDIAQPCPDVFWFPMLTKKFCRQLIEEMENFGQWSDGSNTDPRLEGGYENVPTRDIHMRQVDWEEEWMHILAYYVYRIQTKVYQGYDDLPRARMNFIVRYRPDEQPSLRPHHDSSSYTLNIALNEKHVDFEGGGIRYVRYNCSILETKLGWVVISPGRVTHLHEGLTTTSGTRYIFVTFVNP